MNSLRINVIVSFIDEGASIADVGSDHCQVPILAIKEKKIEYAQAIENKKGPFERMVKEIKNNGLEGKVVPSLSNGISNLDKRVDTVIIAGMGGKLIKQILESDSDQLKSVNTLVIDAHSNREFITKFLEDLGYHLEDNRFFFEDEIPYDVMKWKKGEKGKRYSKEELIFGPLNLERKPSDWLKYWQKELLRLSSIIENDNLPNGVKQKYIQSISIIENILNK